MKEFISSVITRQGKEGRSSVLSTLITLDCIVIPPTLYMISQTNDLVAKIFYYAVVATLVGYTLIKHSYLLKNNPRLLHSEIFLIEDKKLDLIAKQGELPRQISPNEIFEQPKLSLTEQGEKND
jgi:hypothetical protein